MQKKIICLLTILFLNLNICFASEDFNEYLKTLKFNVGKAWIAPVYTNHYTADVRFKIYKDGTIKDIKLVKSSTKEKMDNAAVNSIKNLYKQNPLPNFYKSNFIDVTVRLSNYLPQDLRNPNIAYKTNNIPLNDLIPISEKKVKFKKVIFSEYFQGESNYKDNMKELELNLSIQRALKKVN